MILDVDTGIDDALALLYACASPEVELVGVTCVGGNVNARRVAENTRAVLALAGRPDVPVALGREEPLVKPLETSAETHGPRGIGYADLPASSRPLEKDDAADRIISIARSRPGEVTLVTLGPLTNLAVALEREPSLPNLLGGYVLMGGAFRGTGNTTPTSEWNVYVDPHAAKRVFERWTRPGVAPAAAARSRSASTPPSRSGSCPSTSGTSPCAPMSSRSMPTRSGRTTSRRSGRSPRTRSSGSSSMRSGSTSSSTRSTTASTARSSTIPWRSRRRIDRSLVRSRPVAVDVETGAGLAHGMTVADWRGLTRKPANVEVAIEADASVFLDRFIDRVGRLAAGRAAVAG